MTACSDDDSQPGPRFDFGVASGDPLSDRVILWTHARYSDSDAVVELAWEVATDSAFASVVSSGSASATTATGFTAKATPAALRTQAQKDLLDPVRNPELGYNLDAWDGYPAAREILLGTAAQLRKNLVVLAGDTHNAWHSRLTLMDGTQVGQEFATPAVSSPGLENDLAPLTPEQIQSIFQNVIDDLDWMDAKRRGFLKMKFTATEARGEWIFVDGIASRQYAVDAAAGKTISYRIA